MLQRKTSNAQLNLGLRLWEVASLYDAFEWRPFVAAIAERLALGMAAPAKRQAVAPGKAERLAFLVHEFKLAFNY